MHHDNSAEPHFPLVLGRVGLALVAFVESALAAWVLLHATGTPPALALPPAAWAGVAALGGLALALAVSSVLPLASRARRARGGIAVAGDEDAGREAALELDDAALLAGPERAPETTASLSLRDTLEATLKTAGPLARHKGLALSSRVTPDVPDALQGDAAGLRDVLRELVGNAVEFTERGEVAVVVESTVAVAAPDWVSLHVQVRDTGVGIEPARQPALFENGAGASRGLATARRLVEVMGGQLWVESEPALGSTFHFTVRLRPAGAAPQRLAVAPRGAARPADLSAARDAAR